MSKKQQKARVVLEAASYTRSLDIVAMAMQEYRKGNAKNAGFLFAKAATQPDATYAIGIIEATNNASRNAPKGQVQAKKYRQVRAETEVEDFDFDETDDETQEVLEHLAAEEDFEVEVEEDDEEDDIDEVIDAEEDDIDDVIEAKVSSKRARVFAAALKSMQRRGQKR